MDADVPLVVPEVNPALVAGLCHDAAGRGGIIANPNCSTIQLAVALAPLQRAFGLREVHVTTLQAVSGAGQKGLDELALLTADPGAPCQVFARPIAANVVPEIGPAMPDGSFEEEVKVGRELLKIFDLPQLVVTCTATRVPVACGHAAAVRVLTERHVSAEAARSVMVAWPGLAVAPGAHDYRTPREIAGDTSVHVGRLRGEPGRQDALLFWVVADNLLKGAAWNALQIADLLVGA
jgi:aspartate-semialdehyde dehydrogenase